MFPFLKFSSFNSSLDLDITESLTSSFQNVKIIIPNTLIMLILSHAESI